MFTGVAELFEVNAQPILERNFPTVLHFLEAKPKADMQRFLGIVILLHVFEQILQQMFKKPEILHEEHFEILVQIVASDDFVQESVRDVEENAARPLYNFKNIRAKTIELLSIFRNHDHIFEDDFGDGDARNPHLID